MGSTYRFFDGDGDADFSEQGPRLLHFRSTSLGHIQAARKAGWEKLISENSSLPTVAIRVFDETGNLHSYVIWGMTVPWLMISKKVLQMLLS